MTKLVKFNCNTTFHNIHDDKIEELQKEMKDLLKSNYKNYCERLGSEYSEFEHKIVKVGEECEIPNWYYDLYKDSTTDMPNSFDMYKDVEGKHRPFDMNEAVRHRQVSAVNEMLKSVPMFELIKDLDKKNKIIDANNKTTT